MDLTEQEIHKFLSYVDRRGDNECWLWLGGKSARGYGVFHRRKGAERKISQATHVAIFIDRNEVIPAGRYAIHSCDNPSCVNPRHLRRATPQENRLDCLAKGRDSKPPASKSSPNRTMAMPRGEDNPMSFYKNSDILRICEARKLMEAPKSISDRLGYPLHLVHDIVYGRAWKHLTAAYLPFKRLPPHNRYST